MEANVLLVSLTAYPVCMLLLAALGMLDQMSILLRAIAMHVQLTVLSAACLIRKNPSRAQHFAAEIQLVSPIHCATLAPLACLHVQTRVTAVLYPRMVACAVLVRHQTYLVLCSKQSHLRLHLLSQNQLGKQYSVLTYVS